MTPRPSQPAWAGAVAISDAFDGGARWEQLDPERRLKCSACGAYSAASTCHGAGGRFCDRCWSSYMDDLTDLYNDGRGGD